jgi:hypothetical protein
MVVNKLPLLIRIVKEYIMNVCSVEGCDALILAKGLCNKHYLKLQRYGTPEPKKAFKNKGKKCSVEGCEKPASQKGMCTTHYQRVRFHSSIELPKKDFIKDYVCSVDGCKTQAVKKGMCDKHYHRFKKYGDVNITARMIGNKGQPCSCGEGLIKTLDMCKKCYRKHMRDNEDIYKFKETQRRNSRIRRARKRKTPSENYTTQEVYNKTSGVCGICGERIILGVKVNDPMRLTVDHIIPLSLGGTDYFDNVQPAHSICNSKKNNRI